MRKALRFLPALAVLAMPFALMVCSTDNPTNPGLPGGPTVPGSGTSGTASASAVVTSTRTDLSADGVDSVVLTVIAKDSSGRPLANASVTWSLTTQGYTGAAGNLSSASSSTNAGGVASTGYTAPQLDFVPVGAVVIASATVNLPSNPQGSPRGATTLLLRPKGTGSSTGTGPSGAPSAPVVTAVTPEVIKVDAVPPITVFLQGTGFDQSSQVLIVTSEGFAIAQSTFLSTEQMRFTAPASLSNKPGAATLFVTGPGNVLSTGVAVTLITGSGPATGPSINSVLPATAQVGKPTRVVLLGEGFNVKTCPGQSSISFVGDFLSPVVNKECPVETATENRLVVDAPVSSTAGGQASVFVTNDDGSVSNVVSFTYTAQSATAPIISSLSPSQGATSGETNVIISGQNFSRTDSVVFAAPNLTSDPGDICTGDGLPVCSNNQCILNADRKVCKINGTDYTPFRWIGPGQIQITTPNVGPNAAGPADVLIITASTTTSNIATFTFTAPANLRPPIISFVDPTSFSGDGCCPQGWELLIFGQNFRRCSSVIIRTHGIHEILPTPDITDCGERRNAPDKLSPRERMILQLPPDGMTINCGVRPDLVPFDNTGGNAYQHNAICYNGTSSPYATGLTGSIVGTPPDDFANGGAIQWVNDTTIRVLFAPDFTLPCSSSFQASIYVSNDPGRGIAGDATSAPATVNFSNTLECPTPTPDPTVISLSTSAGTCDGGNVLQIIGTGFLTGTSVLIGAVPLQNLSVGPSIITGTVPPSAALCNNCTATTCGGCGTVGPPAVPANPPYTCTPLNVVVTVPGFTPIVQTGAYTYQSCDAFSCGSCAALGGPCN